MHATYGQATRSVSAGISNRVIVAAVGIGVGCVVLLVLAIVGHTILSGGACEAPVAVGHSSGQQSASADGWHTFKSEEGRFSVELHGELDMRSNPSQKRILGDLLNQVTARLPAGGCVTVTWGDVVSSSSPDTLHEMFNAVQDGLVAMMSGSVRSERAITLQGFPGREFAVYGTHDGKFGTIWTRCYIAGRRYYQINWVKVGAQSAPSPNANRVFDSFKLLSPAS